MTLEFIERDIENESAVASHFAFAHAHDDRSVSPKIAAPDWYQRMVFELGEGEAGDPQRNIFLRKAKAGAQGVVNFETVRRWLLITRITARRSGLLALSARRGPDFDDFTFALVDLVCELRLADRFDFGLDDKVLAAWGAAKAAAPAELRSPFRARAGDPVKLFNACLALLEEDGDDRALQAMVADARIEFVHATRYGALDSVERRAVRAFSRTRPSA
ncbi:MAG: hypothetical protein AAFN79_20130 [Pseudomonadota bacterium]